MGPRDPRIDNPLRDYIADGWDLDPVALHQRIRACEKWIEKRDSREENSASFQVQSTMTARTTWFQTALIAFTTVLAVIVAHFMH